MAEIEELKVLSYSRAGTGDPEGDIQNEESGTWVPGEKLTIKKLNHIDTGIINATEGVKTLARAIDDLDVPNITGLTQDMTNVKSMLDTAKGSHESMLARLNSMEGSIPTAQSLTTQINTAISADATVSSLSSEIQNAHRTGSELVNPANDYVDSLDSRFDAIEAVLRSKNNNSNGLNLNARFIALEAAIETITGSDVDSGSLTALAARIAVLENALKSALDSDEDNVWETLDDYLSDLEQDVADLKTEVGQLDSSRIDVLETTISHTKDENDDNDKGGLTQRIDALETSIGDNEGNSLSGRVSTLEEAVNDANSGLAATKAIADAATTALDGKQNKIEISGLLKGDGEGGITAAIAGTDYLVQHQDISGKANSSDVEALDTRVTALENNPVSATTIIPANRITYDNETGLPTIYTNNNKTTPITPSSDVDYLLEKVENNESKYYYWKYINNGWELISGGGGASDDATASLVLSQSDYNNITKEENIDYYVLDANNMYHHYRFIPNQDNIGQLIQIELGLNPNNIKRYNIAKSYDQATEKTYLDLYEFNYGINNVIDTSTMTPITRVELPVGGGGGGTTSNILARIDRITPQNVVTILSNNHIYLRFYYTAVDAQDTSEAFNGEYVLKFNNNQIISADTIQSGAWSATSINTWQENTTGYYEIDITDYCSLGTQTFDLTVNVMNGNESVATVYRQWSVRIVQLKVESDSPDIIITPVGEAYSLSYIPYGALNKNLHVLVDGTELAVGPTIGSTSSGAHLNYSIPAQEEGTHRIEFYLTATLNGELTPTEHIYKDSIWYNSESINNSIMIASPYRGRTHHVIEYDDITIPYIIYNKNNSTFEVNYYLDYGTGNQQLIDTITGTSGVEANFNYNFIADGNHSLTIKVDNEILTINFVVESLTIDVAQTETPVIDFNPSLLSNSSKNRLPSWTINNEECQMAVSSNFNWADNASGGGYHNDKDGKCFIIKAGTYMEIPYKMFTSKDTVVDGITTTTSRVFNDGAEMKIIFKVADVRSADAVWFTNMAPIADGMGSVGIQLNAHDGSLKTSAANVTTINYVTTTTTTIEVTENGDTTKTTTTVQTSGVRAAYSDLTPGTTTNGNTTIKIKVEWDDDEQTITQTTTTTEGNTVTTVEAVTIETPTAATDTYLYFPYSEEDKIELDININQQGNGEDFILSYEDGVASKAYCYTNSEALYQKKNEEGIIHIGSNNCDVYIYGLKIYNRSLSSNEILRNFIADGANVSEKVKRYNRNSIYYSVETESYSPYYVQGVNTLDPVKLSEKIPDVKVLMLEAPYFTNSKKDFVKDSTLRCIQASGGKVYPADIINDNWYFENGYHSGQGTTSDNYGQSARNIDFLFECDGTHKPSDKVDAIEGYISQITKGYMTTQQQEPEVCTDWKGNDCKVPLTSTSIPNNFFNLKVNVASSENVNNALLQKRYNDFLPYISPAKRRDSRIKNDMEFVPAVLFLRETDTTLANHREFNDTEWHFYALGNLGDSKKTDYTRAYDPTDMNEFTIEISDNNTNNSQFQSGVYEDNDVRTVETADSAINSVGYLYPITESEWSAVREPTAQEIADGEAAKGGDKKKMDVRTAPNNKVYVNYRHRMLSSEAFDGDHSFELRYACKGDYRDGKVVNDTTGKAKAQLAINRGIWEAFYTWVVTSTEQQFIDELEEWCVPDAVEFFYAFTHFYTMMDNRAKNTFWHFAKTGTYRAASRPVAGLLPIYHELIDGEYVLTEDTEIVSGKTYYTQYAFDIWDYDNDTAIGIDNNGKLVFSYGKEDTDYRVAGDASSGYVFNGAGSIFWRRLSVNFVSDIANVFNRVNQNFCFDAANLIEQFDTYQNCYPEEIWRLDIQRKYIRTFTGRSYDNSITAGKQNTRFLREMMQGRKKYQRRQWVKDQEVYFGSKYMLSNIATDTIEMVCYTPGGAVAVQPDYNLVITPYQDMYINVAVGNGNLRNPVRAKGGIPVTIDCTANMNETRIYIYGGSYIQALSNIAPMYIGANIFSNAKRLKSLNLGSDNPNYHNANLTTLTVNPNMPLLETLNIKNCDGLGGIINLSESNNLRVIEAAGTQITGVTLPPYTSITTLHLPSSVNTLNLNSAQKLINFSMVKKVEENNEITFEEDYHNLFTVVIKDSDYSTNINWLGLLSDELSHLTSVQLLQLRTATINNINELEPFATRKNELGTYVDEDTGVSYSFVNLSGTITVTGDWSEVEKTNYQNLWNNELTLVTDQAHMVERRKITYKHSVTNQTLYELYVSQPFYFVDIWTHGDLQTEPTKPSTVSSKFIFGQLAQGEYSQYSGWTIENDTQSIYDHISHLPINEQYYVVPANGMTVYTTFTEQAQTYTVRWLLNEGDTVAIKEANDVPYGGGYDLIAPTVKEIRAANRNTYTCSIDSSGNCNYSIFQGWQKSPVNIRPTDINQTYDIYGSWLTRQNISYTQILNNSAYDIAEKLLVLSKLPSSLQQNNLAAGLNYQVPMGYNGPSTNRIDLLALTNKSKYTTGGQISTINGYYPFAAGESFTIMLDYKFNTVYSNSINEAVLFSCYKEENGIIQGVKLYYNPIDKNSISGVNPAVYVSFGDTNINDKAVYSVNPDAEVRNTIVLRHIAGENVLYIYTGNNGNLVADYNITQFEHTLTWSSNSSSAQMVLGGINNAPSTTMNASGNFYAGYYWPEDLGKSECLAMANWCHENTVFTIEDFKYKNDGHVVNQNMLNNSGLVLHTLTASQMGNITPPYIPSTPPSNLNWKTSTIQSFYNSRIYNGFSTLLQSIISLVPVDYRSANLSGDQYSMTSGGLIDNNYVFAPSYKEVTGSDDTNYSSEAANHFAWHSSNNITAKKWENNNFIAGTSQPYYTNLRFPYVPISLNNSNTVYYNYPSAGTRADLAIGNNLTEGDILILTDGIAYIYASSTSVANGAPIIVPDSSSDLLWCSAGGWIEAKNWSTRSVYQMSSGTRNRSYLMYVNNNYGEVPPSPGSKIEFGLTYSIAI